MKNILLPIVFLLLLSCSDDSDIPTNQDMPENTVYGLLTDQSISMNGMERTYDIYVPTDYDAAVAYPLLIDLHGATQSKTIQRGISEFDSLAETEKFISVFPQGLSSFIGAPINATGPSWVENNSYLPSVEFLGELITEIENDYNINASKIYITGFSMGGILTYLTACELSSRVAAIGVVAGRTIETFQADCSPQRPIPIIHLHGTDDLLVPFDGIPNIGSVQNTIDFWVSTMSCNSVPTEFQLPDSNTSDNSTVTQIVYENCDQNAVIQFFTITNGGHSWPGSTSAEFENSWAGNLNNDINASEVIWEFLNSHSL